MDGDTSDRIERLMAHISAYLSGNRHAADTVIGIQRWWLSGEAASLGYGELEQAIENLVQQGILECRTLPDGSKVFGLARSAATHG